MFQGRPALKQHPDGGGGGVPDRGQVRRHVPPPHPRTLHHRNQLGTQRRNRTHVPLGDIPDRTQVRN